MIETMLLACLDDPKLVMDQKTDIAMALSMWDGTSPSTAARAGRQIAQAMEVADNSLFQRLLAQRLSALVGRMEAQEAASTAALALAALLKTIRNPKNSESPDLPLDALTTVIGNLTPKDAAKVIAGLAQLIREIKDDVQLLRWGALSEFLAAVAGRLDPADIAQTAVPFLEMLDDSQYPDSLAALAENISILAKRMSRSDATSARSRIAKRFLRAMKEGDPLFQDGRRGKPRLGGALHGCQRGDASFRHSNT